MNFRMVQNWAQCFYCSLRKSNLPHGHLYTYMERNSSDFLKVCRKIDPDALAIASDMCLGGRRRLGSGIRSGVEFVWQFLTVLIWGKGVQTSLVSWDSYPAWFRRPISTFKHKFYLRSFPFSFLHRV